MSDCCSVYSFKNLTYENTSKSYLTYFNFLIVIFNLKAVNIYRN